MTVRVELDQAELRRLEHSEAVRADLRERAVRVTAEAARRAREVGKHPDGAAAHWADAMDHEAGTDERGAYEDVSWRHGTGPNEEWRGHFLLFGTSEPNHPAHLDVLLGAVDEA